MMVSLVGSAIRFLTACFLLLGGALFIMPAVADDSSTEIESTPSMSVMTYNIRMNTAHDGENAWPHRRDEVARTIIDSGVQLVGMQEVLKNQIDDLVERLPDYDWYGVGRRDGEEGGEYAPFFYRRDRFERVDQGQFWLSEAPEGPGPPGWDAACTRITTWVKLRDRQTEEVLLFANTHFDHRGSEARRQSALLIRQFCAEQGDIPCIVMGDFNSLIDSESMQILTSAEEEGASATTLRDARSISLFNPVGPDSTWNGFEEIAPGQRIDFILVTSDIDVISHHILDHTFSKGHFPSDHLPVMAEVVIRSEE